MTPMTAGNIIRDLTEMGFIQSVGSEATGGLRLCSMAAVQRLEHRSGPEFR